MTHMHQVSSSVFFPQLGRFFGLETKRYCNDESRTLRRVMRESFFGKDQNTFQWSQKLSQACHQKIRKNTRTLSYAIFRICVAKFLTSILYSKNCLYFRSNRLTLTTTSPSENLYEGKRKNAKLLNNKLFPNLPQSYLFSIISLFIHWDPISYANLCSP